jgi:hypothetical protein
MTMGTYNTLRASMDCPRCHGSALMEIELSFGDTRNLHQYEIGDRYEWLPLKAPQNGGRPENGNLDGEGYVECPLCERDFFVKVQVRADTIQLVEVDSSKAPYVADMLFSRPPTVGVYAPKPSAEPHDDYVPEHNRSLADKDLLPRIRRALETLVASERAARSEEVTVLLLDLGSALDRKGKRVDACRYWYNAGLLARAPFGGWGIAAWEAYRDTARQFRIPESEYALQLPPVELLAEYVRKFAKS